MILRMLTNLADLAVSPLESKEKSVHDHTRTLPPLYTRCCMYPREFPDPGTIVMCFVIKVVEFGIYCTLPEFKGKEAFWLATTRRRCRSTKLRDPTLGSFAACLVLRVDESKGYIDVSTPRIAQKAELEAAEQKFAHSVMVHEVMARTSTATGVSMETLYLLMGWDFYRRFDHAWTGLICAMLHRVVERTLKQELNKIMAIDTVGTTLSYIDFALTRYQLAPAIESALLDAVSVVDKQHRKHLIGLAHCEIMSFGREGVDFIQECFAQTQVILNAQFGLSREVPVSLTVPDSPQVPSKGDDCGKDKKVSEVEGTDKVRGKFDESGVKPAKQTSETAISSFSLLRIPPQDQRHHLSLTIVKSPNYIMAIEFPDDQDGLGQLNFATQTMGKLMSKGTLTHFSVTQNLCLVDKTVRSKIRDLIREAYDDRDCMTFRNAQEQQEDHEARVDSNQDIEEQGILGLLNRKQNTS